MNSSRKKHIYAKIGMYIERFGPLIGLFFMEDYGGDIAFSISAFFFALGGFIRHIMGKQ